MPRSGKRTGGDDGGSAPRERNRREALAELERARVARERRRGGMVWSVIVATLVLIVGGIAYGVWDLREKAAAVDLDGVQSFEVEAGHVTEPVTYKQSPPAGGEHNPIWLNCGVYESPVLNEQAVHSLEHGAVWITYRSDLPKDDVKTLVDATPSTYAILSPMEQLPAPVVVSAWSKQLRLTGADDPRLAKFIRIYQQGPDAPEAGASCTGASDGTLPLDQAEQMQ